MVTMLEEECSSGMHSRGAVLAGPSAAIGLLWARRGLSFWVALFRPHVTKFLETKRKAGSQDTACASGALAASSAQSLATSPPVPSAPAASSTAATAATVIARPSRPDYDSGDELALPPGMASREMTPPFPRSIAPPARANTPTGYVLSGPPSPHPGRAGDPSIDGSGGSGAVASLKESVSGLSQKLMSGVISETGYAEALRAYSESIEPFNGWIARNTFTLTARATPDWETFGLKIAPTHDALAEDVHVWSTAVSAVLHRMREMHQSLDLEDLRKTI